MTETLRDRVATLPDDVLVASFHVGPDWVNLFVVRGGSIVAHRLPFEPRALPPTHHLSPTKTRGHPRAGFTIPDASDLLEPVAQQADGCSLIYLIPHGPLNHYPLHAALIDLAPVVYLPAASMIPTPRPGPQRWRPLVFGNMTGDLGGAEREAEEVAERLDTTPYLGREATLERLRRELPRANLVHIAGHGFFDPSEPLTSGIPFPDGILTVRHVYDLELDDCLVILSGCVTGLGEDRPGEGFSSLVGAFFAAGARGLLVSLWEVDDIATTEFMVGLYEGLVGGVSLPAAIQGSYRRLRDDAERQHPDTAPFYWAPFKPVGDW
jgi:hypothetical protein